jgi:vacuolar-type H+-ATPase subunit E/Vma4
MTYDELVRSVEAAAEEKNREVLERAHRESDEIIRQAHEQAAEISNGFLHESNRALEVERNRLSYLAKQEANASIIQVKQEIFNLAFSHAQTSLKNFRETPGYAEFMRRIIAEASFDLNDPYILHVDPRDLTLVTTITKEQGITSPIKADIECSGGVVISDRQGSITISNTIESRLKKAMDVYSIEIFSEISGD